MYAPLNISATQVLKNTIQRMQMKSAMKKLILV